MDCLAAKDTTNIVRRNQMITKRSWPTILMLTILVSLAAASASAQASQSINSTIPLEGLDPVMLVQGKEVQGDMKITVTRGRFQYIFASAENKTIFEKDPARYEIQLDGACARMGAPVTGDPDLYAVHDGRIYIFGSPECQKLFKAAPEKYLEVPTAPKSPASAEMFKRGKELIEKAAATLGGGNKLDQLVSFQRTDLRGNNVKNTLLVSFPETLRQEVVRPNFTLVSVITPSESFFLVNNRANPMSGAERAAFNRELQHELVVLLRARNKSDFKAASSGSAKVGETAVELVEVELAGSTTTLGIDPATGRVLSQRYRGRGPGGVLGEILISYSDFRTVEGLLLPFKLTTTFDDQPYPALSTTIETATINGQIDPARFEKPKLPS
jgi:YHS domain-containing protein